MALDNHHCILLGAPIQAGASQQGCLMGPDALRTAGIVEAIKSLGHEVSDFGNEAIAASKREMHPNKAIHHLDEVAAWIELLAERGYELAQKGMPVFMGGDHSMSAGSIAGVARAAKKAGRPFYVLWLDAHPDVHTLETTASGNLHGTPLAYLTGAEGFEPWYPKLEERVDPRNVCLIGLRSVDRDEHSRLLSRNFTVHDMRSIDENGIVIPVREFLNRVVDDNGWLHVSLDVDFLDPSIAPGVGTTVPGGATAREAHLIMELVHESGMVNSLDLVELNPFLDERGRTASLLVDLASSLFGKTVLDRQTRSF